MLFKGNLKKGMSTGQIVIALAIGLVLIIILSTLLFRQGGITKKSLDCEERGGKCVTAEEGCEFMPQKFDCPKEKPVCCINPADIQ